MNVIEGINLCKKYKSNIALDDFNVSIKENKIIGLIGRNGAGKTTFLKACTGKIKPDSGIIKVFNENVFDNLNVLSKLIFIDEENQYSEDYKIKEILSLAKIYYPSWDGTFAKKLLKYFNLNTNKKLKTLSKGMKTQVNIIIGICSRMPLTLMDEPTLGLDAAFRKEVYNIILKDYINNPRTIIISSHLLNEIEMLLEEIVLIHEGKLVKHLPLDDIKSYGIRLNGSKVFLEKFTAGRKVLHKSCLGESAEFIIKSSLSQEDYKLLSYNNINIGSVSSQDICIYLTGKGESFDEF